MQTAETAVNLPEVEPFTYVWIPCEESKDVCELFFEGHSEEALRERLTRHFRQVLLSPDQTQAMTQHLIETSKKNAQRAAGQATDSGEASIEPPKMDPKQEKEMIEAFLDNGSYEIVPVTMPTRQTKFIGTSLYIDDSGRFKDFPINNRASRIARREIRGDAFLLSNHDDPALELWRRVDCTLSTYESLYARPPVTTYDVSNQAQMAQTAMQREEETKKLTHEDVEQARRGREDGNRYVATGDFKAALQAYTVAVDHTEGRRDLLENEAEVTELRKAALLNRSLCAQRLGRYSEAAKDAEKAILLDATNPKAYYRLAQALTHAHDYAEARKALQGFLTCGGSALDCAQIQASIERGERESTERLRKNLSKMFN